jgi:putative phage-type endonuclease
VSQARAQFLANRRTGLGGSDVAAILGESLWGCALSVWNAKRGIEAEESISKHLRRGIELEDSVAKWWTAETGRKTVRMQQQRHPEKQWALANIDRRILHDPRGSGVFEAKVPSKYVWLKYRREGLPEQYILQGQHYLFVTGWTWGAYGIFNAELMEFADEGRAPFEFERNDKLIAAFVPKMEIFWSQVENGPAPEKLPSHDPRCARCKYRPMCHEEQTVTAMEEGETRFTDDPAIVQGIRTYAEFSAIEKAAKEEKDAAAEALLAIAPAGKVITPAGSISAAFKTRRFQMKAIEEDRPKLAKILKARYTVEDKEPQRRITPKKESK